MNVLVILTNVYIYRGAIHSSWSDEQDHATVRLKTAEQVESKTHQVAHVYMIESYDFLSYKSVKKVEGDEDVKIHYFPQTLRRWNRL
jgi:hypothetical protein